MAAIVRMPEVLAGTREAAIQTWLVQVGQTIAVGAPLAEVETEKAVVEYAAEIDGTVLELLVGEGQTIAVGDPIAVVGSPGESAPPKDDAPQAASAANSEPASAPEPESAAEPAPSPVAGTPTSLPSDEGDTHDLGTRRFASPIVRRLARERGIDLSSVTGTGPDGRIVRRDLERIPDASAPAEAPQPTPSATPATVSAPTAAAYEDVPLTGMRRAIARRLTESKSTVPHFYVVADCRVDALLALRKQVNAEGAQKVSVNDFVIKAVAAAFAEVPEANATWADTAIRHYSSVDISMAVAIPGGLVTPVLRGVEHLSLGAVARLTVELAARARDGKLKQHELEGGSFSVSNLGMFGVKEFSAIINPPQAAILAVGAAQPRPVVEDGAIAVASVMTVTLSADHRVLDGALAAQWLAAFVRIVENPIRILL